MQVDDVLTLAADDVDLRSPLMLVALTGFFDVGGAATTALESLSLRDRALTIGEIDPDPFYDFTQTRPYIVIEDGERRIEWPQNRIQLVRGEQSDAVTLIGHEPHLHWRTYADCVISTAARLGCSAVVTVGALADSVPHTRPPRVVASTTDASLADALGIGGPTYQGVTGVAGVLQVALADAHIPAVSVRVSVPHYLMNTDQPSSALALRQHVASVLGWPTPEPDGEERREITAARSLHDELVDNDPQLAAYIAALEEDYDRRAEGTLPSADELGHQLQAFLNEQADTGIEHGDDGADVDDPGDVD